MSARTAGVTTRISAAIARPRPLAFGSSVWVMTPSSTKASCARTWLCWWRSEEHTSELQSHRDLHSFPTRRSSDLRRHRAPAALGLREQRLGDDPLEHEGELRAHLALLVTREDVDDAVDRFGRAVGVQRGEGEVSRLGDRERRLDRV